jgi:hypothetical protein
MHVMETLLEKNVQSKKQVDELAKQFQELEKLVQREHTTGVARDEPQVIIWGLLEQGILGVKHSKKGIMDQRKHCALGK